MTHSANDRLDSGTAAILRSQAPAERLATLDAMWRSAVMFVRAGVKAQHPDWSEARLSAETARRMACRRGLEPID